jgi:hypothetical protein
MGGIGRETISSRLVSYAAVTDFELLASAYRRHRRVSRYRKPAPYSAAKMVVQRGTGDRNERSVSDNDPGRVGGSHEPEPSPEVR